MILKAVLINRTEIFTDPDMHYNAMCAWLISHDPADRVELEKALDAGTVDMEFGYVDSDQLDKFRAHQFESAERRGERWIGVSNGSDLDIFRPYPPLHDDPSEFTGGWIDESNEITPLQMDYLCGKVKGNNK